MKYFTNLLLSILVAGSICVTGITGCSDPTIKDTEPPEPGGDGIIEVSEVTETTLKLTWERGTDDRTPQVELMYCVYMSDADNIDSFQDAVENGTKILDWIADNITFDTLLDWI